MHVAAPGIIFDVPAYVGMSLQRHIFYTCG
jgi:hypothetical protein